MKNVRKVTLTFVALLLALASCSTLKVTSDKDHNVDFNQYTTIEFYGWEDNSDQIMNRFDRERVEKAFADEFAQRNLKLVSANEGGELVVSLYIVTEQKTSTTAHTSHMGGYGGYYDYGPGWGWGGGHSTTTFNDYDYEVGTLLVSVYDKKEQRLIWESVGVGTVDDNPQSRERKIPAYVKQIMSKYPVEAPK